MMLERRTKKGIQGPTQLKDGGKDSDKDKLNGKDGDGDHEGKTQHEKTDQTNHLPSHTVITKAEPVDKSTQPAVEKISPSTSPGMRRLTYNPITHAPSMWEFICPYSPRPCTTPPPKLHAHTLSLRTETATLHTS